MQAFTLPGTTSFNVLLTGDTDFVVEFATILESKSIAFSILPPMDELDELDVELDMVDQAIGEASFDTEEFGAFADRVVGDVRDNAGTFSHIIDLSITSPLERRTLEVASVVNPSATVIVSVLTTTATEIGSVAGIGSRIVGVGIAPSIMSAATRIDIAGGLNTRAIMCRGVGNRRLGRASEPPVARGGSSPPRDRNAGLGPRPGAGLCHHDAHREGRRRARDRVLRRRSETPPRAARRGRAQRP